MFRQIAFLLIFGAIGFVIVYIKTHHGHLFGIHVTPLQRPGSAGGSGSSGTRAAFEPTFEWTVLWIAVVLAVVAAVGLSSLDGADPKGYNSCRQRRRSAKSSRHRSAMRSTTWRPSPTRGAR